MWPVWMHGSDRDWPSYLGDDERSHYSRLSQINTQNVSELEVAWTYRPGTAGPGSLTQIQCNPLIVDGVFYGTTALQVLVALDAATGRERWRFDPTKDGRSRTSDRRHRGVVHWAAGDDRRILLAHDHFLYAIDASSGRPILSFGDQGAIDFRAGLGGSARANESMPVGSGTPGVIFEDLYILSTRTAEVMGAAPGDVRAYDVRTGRLAWTFHTIPHPGEFGYETWPAGAWTSAGGANCWAGMALDAKRGLVFVPTGSAVYDFWGGRRLGENLFANSLICLDARTGRRVWHYQIVHHDLWDRDLPAPPTLLTVQRNGVRIDAVAQVTKAGHIFVFDRVTGAPVFPIDERPVPSSDLPGEVAWPTQPVPTKPAPISRQTVTAEDLTTLTPAAHRNALERFARLRQSLLFQPPSREGTIVAPGQDGGAEWGGAAADPAGVLYVNGSDTPGIVTMVDVAAGRGGTSGNWPRNNYLRLCAGCHGIDRSGNKLQNIPSVANLAATRKRNELVEVITRGKGVMPPFGFLPTKAIEELADYLLTPDEQPPAARDGKNQTPDESVADPLGVPFGHQFARWVDSDGYPAVKPPWGTLNAVDLNSGEYLWRVPLGEYPELTARGIPPTGSDNYGGPIVTAGGLVFIAATRDEMIRAFDQKTGRILWQAKLPAAGYATPATYSVGGRQYVVFACGGGKLGSRSDDAYVAFALPEATPERARAR